jgi:hypothetical protein
MVMLLVYGSELGGLAATLASDLDPLLAKFGVKGVWLPLNPSSNKIYSIFECLKLIRKALKPLLLAFI